ncbi:MAG: signal peptidase II [Parachlamydiaceae bacterium]
MSLFNRKSIPIWIGLFVLIADFASKCYTHAYLPIIRFYTHSYPYGGIGVFKDFFGIEFSISHQINHGAAWGILAEYQVPLLYFRIGLIACLVVYALFINQNHRWSLPLALIIAGAVGNVIDYFVYGHVVDMIHFVLWGYDFPVFNIADSAISIGIFLLLALSLFQKNSHSKRAR